MHQQLFQDAAHAHLLELGRDLAGLLHIVAVGPLLHRPEVTQNREVIGASPRVEEEAADEAGLRRARLDDALPDGRLAEPGAVSIGADHHLGVRLEGAGQR